MWGGVASFLPNATGCLGHIVFVLFGGAGEESVSSYDAGTNKVVAMTEDPAMTFSLSFRGFLRASRLHRNQPVPVDDMGQEGRLGIRDI